MRKQSHFPFLLFFCLFFAALTVNGQQSLIWQDENSAYREALDLYEKKQYASGLELFKRVKEKPSNKHTLIGANAAFYEAMCAIQLLNNNADELMMKFIREYPENAFTNKGTLELALFKYRQRRYKDALAWFSDVDYRDLNSEELAEYYFKSGYSAFRIDRFDEAKKNFFEIRNEETAFSAAAQYYYSHIEYTSGNYETALQGFLKLEGDPVFGGIVPYYIAQIYFLQGKHEEVIKYGPSLLDSAEASRAPELARIIGESYFALEKYQEAVPYLERFVKERTPLPGDQYQLAYALFKSGNCKQAISHFQLLTNDDTYGQSAWYNLAKCYLETGQKEYARTAFSSASKQGGDKVIEEDAAYHFALLAYELSHHPYNDAVTAINNYLLRYPDSPRKDKVNSLLVNAFMTTRNYRDALIALDKIEEKSAALIRIYQDVLFNRGVQLFNAGSYSAASDHFTRALQNGSNPTVSASALYWKADAAYRQKNYIASAELFEDFLVAPIAATLPQYFDAHYNLGYVYYMQKKYPKAITSFRTYAQIMPTPDRKKQTDALLRTGDAFFITKDFAGAADFYGRASAGNLHSDYALFQQALSLGLSGRPNDKITALNKLTKSYSSSRFHDDALFETGRTYQQIDQPQKALEFFDRVVKTGESKLAARAGVQKGLVYYNLSQDDQALAEWKAVVAKYPGTEESYAAINQIKNLMVNSGRGGEFATYIGGVSFADMSTSALDSVAYESGERAYMAGDCEKTINSMTDYLNRYQEGIFVTNARYYRGECYWKGKNYESALADFRVVIGRGTNDFTNRSLVKAGNILFFTQNYSEAINVYTRLEKESNQPQHKQEALAGLMRAYFKTGDTLNAAAYADKVNGLEKIPADVKEESDLIRGLGQFTAGNPDNAYLILNKLANTHSSENAAIARYYSILILFKKEELKEAETAVFDMANKFSGYEFWLAKAFIVLADIYVKNGDFFQAKATLESIIDNYSGEDLREVAREKLKQTIELEEAAAAPVNEPEELEIDITNPEPGEE